MGYDDLTQVEMLEKNKTGMNLYLTQLRRMNEMTQLTMLVILLDNITKPHYAQVVKAALQEHEVGVV